MSSVSEMSSSSTQDWESMPDSLRFDLIQKMPADVKLFVKRGGKLTNARLKELCSLHYDFDRTAVLWHVSDSDSKDRKIFREMSRDLFEARLKDTASLSKLYNCNAKIYPKDVLAQVVLSNNLRPRRGHHWEVTFSEMKLLMDDVDVAAVDGGGESK